MEKYDNKLVYAIGIICIILFVGSMLIGIAVLSIDPLTVIVSAFILTVIFLLLTPSKWYLQHGKVRE